VAEPAVYTVEQVAELLVIGRTAAYDGVRRGEIPSVRIGRCIRIPRHALEQMLTANGSAVIDPTKKDADGL
jgi:excisionase family DNA binding protein